MYVYATSNYGNYIIYIVLGNVSCITHNYYDNIYNTIEYEYDNITYCIRISF